MLKRDANFNQLKQSLGASEEQGVVEAKEKTEAALKNSRND